MVNVSFSNLWKRRTRSSHSHWAGKSEHSRVLPQGNDNSPTLWHNILWKDMNFLDISQNKTLDHYINNNVLVRPNEKEMASTLKTLLQCMPSRQ